MLDQINEFCERWDLTKTQFGSMAVRSPSLVDSLRRGRNLRPVTIEKITAFIAAGDPRPATPRNSRARAYMRAKSRNKREEAAAKLFRATDQTEQAKRFIRSRAWTCFEAEILRPHEHGKFYIGKMLVTKAEMLAFARKHGWDG